MIYVHVPFCRSKCAYCDFFSRPLKEGEHLRKAGLPTCDALKEGEHLAPSANNWEEIYVDCLLKELDLRKSELAATAPPTIYIGGGTPSMLSHSSLSTILSALLSTQKSRFPDRQTSPEITLEANPEDVTTAFLQAWASLGINRISMGVQSLCDSELSLIGRRHTAAQALAAIEALASGPISNFSIDLICGLPGQTLSSWTSSVEKALSYRPPHFSAYILSYEPRTRLTAMLHAGKIAETQEDEIISMHRTLCAKAESMGYCHYEISNFCQPGFQSVHNSAYWSGCAYLGLGPAAHSFDGHRTRRANPCNLKKWADTLCQGRLACEVETESDADTFNDRLLCSLRTLAGLPLADIPTSRLPRLMRDAAPFLADGSLVLSSTSLSIPPSRWLISDSIISSLFQD